LPYAPKGGRSPERHKSAALEPVEKKFYNRNCPYR